MKTLNFYSLVEQGRRIRGCSKASRLVTVKGPLMLQCGKSEARFWCGPDRPKSDNPTGKCRLRKSYSPCWRRVPFRLVWRREKRLFPGTPGGKRHIASLCRRDEYSGRESSSHAVFAGRVLPVAPSVDVHLESASPANISDRMHNNSYEAKKSWFPSKLSLTSDSVLFSTRYSW